MKVERFNSPGNLKDFDGAMAQKWSDQISQAVDGEIAALLQENPGIQPQFYNPAKLDVSGSATPISWPAFPNKVELSLGDDPPEMFKAAEQRDNQDEYLEWSTLKQNGKITRIMFTCEGPEYWRFVAQNDPDLLVALYSKIAGQSVPKKDLLTPAGSYIARNKWNLSHAVHLIQSANNLGAEINIAAQATVLRRHGGHDPVTSAVELIRCSRFGQEERNSDPHIGDVINAQAREGRSVALLDPIGLYIQELPPPDQLKVRKPDGTPAGNYWKEIERGDKDHILRAVYEVPAGELSGGKPFVVGEMKIEGDLIEFGGQLARFLRIKLSGVIGKAGVFHNATFPCPGGGLFAGLAPAANSRVS